MKKPFETADVRLSNTKKLSIAGLMLALGVLFPQFFHIFMIPNAGQIFLPMHFPVLICSLLCRGFFGALVGLFSPVLSFFLTGMPNAARLGFMAIELCAYGLFCGMFYENFKQKNKKLKIYLSLFLSMVLGRAVWFLAILAANFIFKLKLAAPIAVINAVTTGIWGIILQLITIPPIVISIEKHFSPSANSKIQKAKQLLESDKNLTLAVINGKNELVFNKTGIAPLINLLTQTPAMLAGACVADKIIGKAAAMLMVKGGASKVYAHVISDGAKEVFDCHKVLYTFDKSVPFIKNRAGDGMCPMEQTVKDIDDVDMAYEALLKKTEELKTK